MSSDEAVVLEDGPAEVLGLLVTLVAFLGVGCCAGGYVKKERERMASYVRYDRYLSHEEEGGLFYAGEEQALMGRLMEFRGKDYYSDFSLAAVTGVGCYGLLYQLCQFGAFQVLYLLASFHVVLVVFPLVLLFLSLGFPSRLHGYLSFHLRLSYHAVVHHRAAEKLNKCRGPFMNYNAIVLIGFALGLSSLDMCRYLPWRLTRFCVMSRGYPSWAAFKWLQGCHIALLTMYITVQSILLLPTDYVDIRTDAGRRIYQSLAIPSREVMSNYVKGHDAGGDANEESSVNMLSTGALFGLVLLLLLLYRLGRGLSQHKRLLTRGRTWRRTLFEACVSLPSLIFSFFCNAGRHHDAVVSVRPVASDAETNSEFAVVGHELADIRYRYAEDDDHDFLESRPRRMGVDGVRSRMHGEEKGYDEDDDGDDGDNGDNDDGVGDEGRALRAAFAQSIERMRAIDEKLELARGKRLIASQQR